MTVSSPFEGPRVGEARRAMPAWLRAGARACVAATVWLGRYVWAGWVGLAGLFCLAAGWQAGHEFYGSFILPAPLETVTVLFGLFEGPELAQAASETAWRSLGGFLLAAGLGTLAGSVAGYSFAAMRIMRPIVTVILGVPPIAWIVLALIWFGSGGGSAVLTVVLASFPISFAGALEGAATRDRALDAMARSFGASLPTRFRTVTLPHLLSYLFPAWTTTAGNAWKVTVMAELLSNTGGIGGQLATARALFDIPLVTAWILLVVAFALITEYGMLNPLREMTERWRSAGLPWGVKR
ncbi:NitT/TauT family transport system permease protein [Pseudochelatococcus lubricantis]|uniref:NitT/TauT family transport system permease protein n=1 Tax=Pseudochelatococcus lubricantis TaxID=1538102 RepID=A0ABX0V7J7_9HYPH|nr:ABC transporter permease [Pseudochelatococcus lubricantis]NIJ59755.1 NitT/TauT family transport system permease protein [Pseudochelatococcus lubricantis]